jgi:hypothetical protein
MKTILAVLVVALAAGCATVEKVETGERTVGERMLLTLEGPWNRVNAPGMGPAQVWTMEGLTVDQLLVYSGIKDEELVHASGASGRKSFSFRSAMQPDEIVAMFEGTLTRDGSHFTLNKLEPASFGAAKGFRFEYAIVRRVDNAQLSGVGYGVVSNGELFALLYQAPRLAFFPRHLPRVEQIARSARVRTGSGT